MMSQDRPRTTRPKTRVLLSVPLSTEQKVELARLAGAKPVSAYARERLFPANDNEAPAQPARTRAPAKDTAALAKALALLGPVSSVLKSLAHAMASGALPFSPNTEAAILKACADITETKALLMKGLGIRER